MTTHDVFTIAARTRAQPHSYFSNHAQHYAKADYKIFVAEVASTVNEVLLLKHILGKAEDKKLKKYLLSYFLEMIRTTLFRQTQFAEFEFIAHTMAENGEPLTKEKLSSEYLELNKNITGKAWCPMRRFHTNGRASRISTMRFTSINMPRVLFRQWRSSTGF